MMEELKSSAESEGKSSAGDKHETGRAMVHLEQEIIQRQLSEVMHQLTQHLYTKNIIPSEVVQNGSLVQTDKGYYYLSVGLGRIHWNDQEIIALSSSSPFGQALLGKKAQDVIVVNKNAFRIVSVNG